MLLARIALLTTLAAGPVQDRERGGGVMVKTRVERRLAAILAADVAGYSRLVGADEEGTLARFKTIRADLVDPKINEHYGRIVKTTGDGLLAEFSSVIDALRCAIEVQAGMTERNAAVPSDRRIEWRIGINVGDIVEAATSSATASSARLNPWPNRAVSVSARVQEDAAGKSISFRDMGSSSYTTLTSADLSGQYRGRLRPALSLPDRPSIAVLAFTNMSCDPSRFFIDRISEEIITVLSKSRSLFVIAGIQAAYKGKKVAVNDIGRELGVRHVLEGSVQGRSRCQ
jgi:adenylate cyclase